MCRMVGYTARDYVDNISFNQTADVIEDRGSITTELIFLVPIASILLLFFLYLEIPSMMEDGTDYLTDMWNIIDMSIVYLNMVFLIMITGDVITG